MSAFEPDYDAIVVGAGPAGSSAALELARAGKSVLLVDRGDFAGSKNMTGGRIYAHCLHELFPDTFDEIPLERRVTHERISLLAPDACTTIDFSSAAMREEGRESYTVLRVPFDQWMAQQAEEAGADVACGITVTALLKDEDGSATGSVGRVYGIKADEDELTALVVILCDGANSLLAKQAVGFEKPAPHVMAVGIKQVLSLSAEDIEQRFQCGPGDGAAWLFTGDVTHGVFGGGIIYTNKDSLSVGIVAGIEAAASGAGGTILQMLEDFKAHPAIAPVLEGATVVEHSGHMIPEGGLNAMPALVGDGVVLAGDTAMMCVNLGYMVRGLDYAIVAGMIAGRSCARALDACDTSAAGLSAYETALNDSFVMKDLKRYQNAPAFLANFNRMFGTYPEMAREVLNNMFIVDGKSAKPIKGSLTDAAKKVGYLNILRDARGAMSSL